MQSMVTSNAPLRLSVAICTRNRARSLRDVLDRLTKVRIPLGVECQIVIVDNASTDDTNEVIDSFAGRLSIRRLFEPIRGVSNARNRAIEHCTGDYVLWIDDDVEPEENWIEAYAAAIRQNPDYSIFGGPIHVRFHGQPPKWLIRALSEVGTAYCLVDHGNAPIDFEPVGSRIPLGSNYVIRKSAYEIVRYDPRLGPGSDLGLLGDETVLIRQMLSAGLKGIWVPEARVQHVMPSSRQTIRHLQHWFKSYGATLGFLTPSAEKDEWPTLCGFPRWMLREIATTKLLFWFGYLFLKPEIWSRYLVRSAISAGQLSLWCSQRELVHSSQPRSA